MPEPTEQPPDAAPGLNSLTACGIPPVQALSAEVYHSESFCTDMIQDDRHRQRTATLECFPKHFSLADPKQNTLSTEGTMFFMSPCGAKIFCTEMISSESMSRQSVALGNHRSTPVTQNHGEEDAR